MHNANVRNYLKGAKPVLFMKCVNTLNTDSHLPLQKPENTEWENGLEACKAALDLEKHVNQALLDLHKVADTHNDRQVKG